MKISSNLVLHMRVGVRDCAKNYATLYRVIKGLLEHTSCFFYLTRKSKIFLSEVGDFLCPSSINVVHMVTIFVAVFLRLKSLVKNVGGN